MSTVTAARPDTSTGAGRARAAVVSVALAAGALASSVVVLWQPWGQRDQFGYADLAPLRDAAWTGAVIDALGFAAMGVAVGIAVCLLVPARGAVWATVGAVLSGLGGVAFAAGMASFGVLVWYVTATDALPAAAGTTLMAYVEANMGHVGALQAPGFLAFTVGTLVLMVALWRSRSVPRWLPIGYGVLTVGVFALDGRPLDVVQAVQMLTLTVLAGFLWRARVTG
jgi:hypothetical protein